MSLFPGEGSAGKIYLVGLCVHPCDLKRSVTEKEKKKSFYFEEMKCIICTVFPKCTILELLQLLGFLTNLRQTMARIPAIWCQPNKTKQKNPPLALLTCPVSLGRWWILVRSPCLLTERHKAALQKLWFLIDHLNFACWIITSGKMLVSVYIQKSQGQ